MRQSYPFFYKKHKTNFRRLLQLSLESGFRHVGFFTPVVLKDYRYSKMNSPVIHIRYAGPFNEKRLEMVIRILVKFYFGKNCIRVIYIHMNRTGSGMTTVNVHLYLPNISISDPE